MVRLVPDMRNTVKEGSVRNDDLRRTCLSTRSQRGIGPMSNERSIVSKDDVSNEHQ